MVGRDASQYLRAASWRLCFGFSIRAPSGTCFPSVIPTIRRCIVVFSDGVNRKFCGTS